MQLKFFLFNKQTTVCTIKKITSISIHSVVSNIQIANIYIYVVAKKASK